jgi:hypothetical protein
MMKIIPLMIILFFFFFYGCETLPSPLTMEYEDLLDIPGPYIPFQESTGVNIHFTGAPEDLLLIKDAGFRWIRMDMTWSRIETVSGWYLGWMGSGHQGSVLSRTSERVYRGKYSLLFNWQVDPKNGEQNLCYAEIDRMYRLPDDTESVNVAIYGDNSDYPLKVRITDKKGETFQYNCGTLSFYGWKIMTIPMVPSNDHWGGNNDGIFDYPIHLQGILVDPPLLKTGGKLYIDTISISRSSRRTTMVIEDFEKISDYDFTETGYDTLVEEAQRLGLNNYFILDYGNTLYETDMSVRTERGRKAFAAFAAEAVERYDQYYIVWEIWNEPNLHLFWSPQPSIDDYMVLVEKTSKAIRKIDPYAIIYAPAASCIPLLWLEECFKKGLLQFVDGVSVHPYRKEHPETVIEDYKKLRQLIQQYKPQKKKIRLVSGEWGYSQKDYLGNRIDEEQQASYAVRMMLVNYFQGMSQSIWYDFKNDGTEPDNTEHNFGLMTFQLEAKKAYHAVKTLNTMLRGYTFKGKIKSRKTDYILQFTNDDNAVIYTLWTTGKTHAVVFPFDSEHWEVYDMYENDEKVRVTTSGFSVRLSCDVIYVKQKI